MSINGQVAPITAPNAPTAHTAAINDIYAKAWEAYQKAGVSTPVVGTTATQPKGLPPATPPAKGPPSPPPGRNATVTQPTGLPSAPRSLPPPPPPPSGNQASSKGKSMLDEMRELGTNPIAKLKKATPAAQANDATPDQTNERDALLAAIRKGVKLRPVIPATQQPKPSNSSAVQPTSRPANLLTARLVGRYQAIQGEGWDSDDDGPGQTTTIRIGSKAGGALPNPLLGMLDADKVPENIKPIVTKAKITQKEFDELKAFAATVTLSTDPNAPKDPSVTTPGNYAPRGKGLALRNAITALVR